MHDVVKHFSTQGCIATLPMKHHDNDKIIISMFDWNKNYKLKPNINQNGMIGIRGYFATAKVHSKKVINLKMCSQGTLT